MIAERHEERFLLDCSSAHADIIPEFSEETIAICSATFKRLDELSPDDDITGMVQRKVKFTVVDEQSTREEKMYVRSSSAFYCNM